MAEASGVNGERLRKLHVRLFGENRAVDIEKGWSVLQLKEQLCKISGRKLDELHIIFAGHVLADDLTLEECELGQRSVVHVVASVGKAKFRESQQTHTPLRSHGVSKDNGRIESRSKRRKKSKFYVYCKSICNKAQPGKLRVRCASCKDEAFQLARDPAGWEDVLERGKINGSCIECNCKKAEFFFKCTGHKPFGDARDEAVPLSHVSSNTLELPCLACFEVIDPVLTFPCKDMHSLCLPCFSSFCESKIKDRQLVLVERPKHIGFTLPCPGGGDSCNNTFIEEIHHFRVSGNEVYEKYQRFATEDVVLRSGGILCPGRGCGSGIFPEDNVRRILCSRTTGGCGLVFCRNCLQEYHSGDCNYQAPDMTSYTQSYSCLAENALKTQRETEKCLKVIRETTKPCPGCRSPIEKAGGCNHMTCQRCNFEWCWVCEFEWNSNCQSDHWFRTL